MDYDVRTEAHEFLVGELMAACAVHFKTLNKPWHSLREQDQRDVLARLRADTEKAVRETVDLIASDGRYAYRAHVKRVQFNEDGVTALLELAKTPEVHDLADRSGSTVLVINEDGRRYLGGSDVVEADPDQSPLFDASTQPKE